MQNGITYIGKIRMFAGNLRLRAGRFAGVFVGAAMLLSFAGLRRRTAWSGDSGGNVSLTVTAASTLVQANAPVILNVQ
jgi:hypothetical protein